VTNTPNYEMNKGMKNYKNISNRYWHTSMTNASLIR
jgi:hypothetical protein